MLTNSLAYNDVVAVHAGDAKFLDDLLATSAEIYELRADAGVVHKQFGGKSTAGLHTKALMLHPSHLNTKSAKVKKCGRSIFNHVSWNFQKIV